MLYFVNSEPKRDQLRLSCASIAIKLWPVDIGEGTASTPWLQNDGERTFEECGWLC